MGAWIMYYGGSYRDYYIGIPLCCYKFYFGVHKLRVFCCRRLMHGGVIRGLSGFIRVFCFLGFLGTTVLQKRKGLRLWFRVLLLVLV